MSKELRGSEKLMGSCSSMMTLSQEELDQVAGGAAPQILHGDSFPYGIIDVWFASIKQPSIDVRFHGAASPVIDLRVAEGIAGISGISR